MPYPVDAANPGDLLALLGPSLLPYLKGSQALYLTGEESLRLRSFNSAAGVTLALEGRLLRPDGSCDPMSSPHQPTTDRSAVVTVHSLGPGWIQHVSVRASAGSPRVGECFVVVELVRGQAGAMQPLGVILQGYVTDTSGLAWPGASALSSAAGPGVIRSIAGADPAAGAEFSETVPTNARWRLLGVDVALVTDATAANRTQRLIIDDGATIVAEITPAVAQTATLTWRYSYARNVQRGVDPGGTLINAPLPDAWLMGGYRVRSATTNLQAGDNYGAPQLWVEEWIED
jgi:hypothetical protein